MEASEEEYEVAFDHSRKTACRPGWGVYGGEIMRWIVVRWMVYLDGEPTPSSGVLEFGWRGLSRNRQRVSRNGSTEHFPVSIPLLNPLSIHYSPACLLSKRP